MTEAELKELFANNLQRIMDARHLSTAMVSIKTGLHANSVRHALKEGTFTAYTLAALAEGLHVQPWELLEEYWRQQKMKTFEIDNSFDGEDIHTTIRRKD